MNLPKTKIVCTVGPASDSPEVLTTMIENGMSVARLNFSHGTHKEHGRVIGLIREISERLGRPVAILQDLGGPKIRVGAIAGDGLPLQPGQQLILTNQAGEAKGNRVSVSYGDLPSQVKAGNRILLADGLMELTVEYATASDIVCTVVTGGVLTSFKGINLPASTLDVPSLTDKDQRDLAFGLEMEVDFVALSFVRSAADIHAIKKMILRRRKDTPVIAKIEKHEAVAKAGGIIEAADGIMVARGDLGVEIPLEDVPSIQKMLVHKANDAGKPVIIATQMLRSMVDAPRPTRAEAADVANGVLDGADAVMLSEETAMGKHPVAAVRYMALIAMSAERNFPHDRYLQMTPRKATAESVAHAACMLARHIDAAAIVATTRSGATAAQIARYRPAQPLLALSPDAVTVRRLALYWGCRSTFLDTIEDTDEMVEGAAAAVLAKGDVQKGDKMVITAGRPIWEAGTTNMLWVKTL
ncbi:pyruvate kinase [Desulfatitalea alkaliphila]|uniref:Pyruvate kinase n=1 Tax=Desulfatitalea alkaliphila TaxID=2929485 RepID=A0AA41R368_9BACT|nr:pyruvate kinase [Desulfatitalea alkaliphila]MCJ8500060.1 pyruvate kinase [Desulfatitalea alkaliphila]